MGTADRDASEAGDASHPSPASRPGDDRRRAAWLTPGVRGIGLASLFSDIGHEVPTSLLPGFLTTTLGAPAAALGLIEGIADGGAGLAKLAGGALADDPERRRATAIGGYATTAVLSGAIGLASNAVQVGLLRTGAWLARGLRQPSRNALLADMVPTQAYGRAYGFERAMDNLGAILGPLLGLALVAAVGVRSAIVWSTVPGLMAVLAMIYAIRVSPRPEPRARRPIRLQLRPVLRGRLGRVLIGVGAFELGNMAATLLILRATELLRPERGEDAATMIALALYVTYNLAATLTSVPAGRAGDRRGASRVLMLGVAVFVATYVLFAVAGPSIALLALGFVAAGIGIGCVETAEHAAIAGLAPEDIRGSAFGVLAAMQSAGNLAASGVAGIVWTTVSPRAAFIWAAAWCAVSLVLLRVYAGGGRRSHT
jgi:MFS family permease